MRRINFYKIDTIFTMIAQGQKKKIELTRSTPFAAHNVNNYDVNIWNVKTRILHLARRYDTLRRNAFEISWRGLLKNSRVFRIRYFVGRFTVARRSFVKAKYRSAESYLRSFCVANLAVRCDGFCYFARALHEHHLNYVYSLNDSLSVWHMPRFP